MNVLTIIQSFNTSLELFVCGMVSHIFPLSFLFFFVAISCAILLCLLPYYPFTLILSFGPVSHLLDFLGIPNRDLTLMNR